MSTISILKCKLKKEVKDGIYISSVKREQGKQFVLTDVPESSVRNIKKYCDVEIVETLKEEKKDLTSGIREIEVEVERKKTPEEIVAEKELLEFAKASWELAIEQKEIINKLEKELEAKSKLTKSIKQKKEIKETPGSLVRKRAKASGTPDLSDKKD